MDPRDQTFMTIHNLTPDANILFASDSISDILGYQPHEVEGRSCFDYFHPDEVPFARSVHNRGVLLDKAAVLHYARIRSSNGLWVSCECCFTIVHDVLVACTSIYLGGEKSERRALEAPQIRRLFSCSPRDPRYHMLEYLSPKFKMAPTEREPRAALILNRFTRNLSIMFSTNAVSTILGLRPDEIKDMSFYECIQENCLQDAIRCLESAKANESIAYLRFWFRDPRGNADMTNHNEQNNVERRAESHDTEDGQVSSNTSDSDGGGVQLHDQMDVDMDPTPGGFKRDEIKPEQIKPDTDDSMGESPSRPSTHATSSRNGTAPSSTSHSGLQPFSTPLTAVSSATAGSIRELPEPGVSVPAGLHRTSHHANSRGSPTSFELEAVVSCTSDGLVVVLRRARPPIPPPHAPAVPAISYENGLFAAPWGQRPIHPHYPPESLYNFQAPLLPQYMPLRENVKAAGGPPLDQLMSSIREVAVFAWALVGINGNLATYGRGSPRGGAQPPDGLPVWDPGAGVTGYMGPVNLAIDNRAAYANSAEISPPDQRVKNPVHRNTSVNAILANGDTVEQLNPYQNDPANQSFWSNSGGQPGAGYQEQPQYPHQHQFHNPLMQHPAQYQNLQTKQPQYGQQPTMLPFNSGYNPQGVHGIPEVPWTAEEMTHDYKYPQQQETEERLPGDGDAPQPFHYGQQ